MTTLYLLLVCGTNLLSVLLSLHKCLTKEAMNVKQTARESSGTPLFSYVLNACIGSVA